MKYDKYIIKKPKPTEPLTVSHTENVPQDMYKRILYLDDEVIKGAFYATCSWFGKAHNKSLSKPHAHDWDEVLAFIGSNPEDPSNLGGEFDIWLDDEKHTITESCFVYIPKGLKHCPIVHRRIDRPIIHLSIGTTTKYSGEKK